MTVSYVDIDEYKAYCLARGLSEINSDTTIIAKGIIASEWLDARYRTQFPGRKTGGRDQEREWPRVGASDNEGYAIDSTVVPNEVKNASFEVLRRELASPGILSKDYTPNQYQSASVSGAVSVVYTSFNTAAETQIQIQIVNDILSSILCMSDGNILSGGSFR